MMSARLKNYAEAAVKELPFDASQETIRDTCDTISCGELDCMQLDVVCSMVGKQLKERD